MAEREPDTVERGKRKERRGAGAAWLNARSPQEAPWWRALTGPLGGAPAAGAGGLGASAARALRSRAFLGLLLGAVAAGGGYALVASFKQVQELSRDSGASAEAGSRMAAPAPMVKARGTFGGSLELLSGANHGKLREAGKAPRGSERSGAARPAPPPLPERGEGGEAGFGAAAAGGGGEAAGALAAIGLPGGAPSNVFIPFGAAGRGGGKGAVSRGKTAAAGNASRGSAGRSARAVPGTNRSALMQLKGAQTLSRAAVGGAPEQSQFKAAQAFEGASVSGAGQPIAAGAAGSGPAGGPDVGGGRPLGGSSGSPSRANPNPGPAPAPSTDCALASNQELELCKKIKDVDVPTGLEGLLSKARVLFYGILAALAAALILRRLGSPAALAVARILALGALAGSAVLAGMGSYAMIESGMNSGLAWLLAGGVLLMISLRVARGLGPGGPQDRSAVEAEVGAKVVPEAEEAHRKLKHKG